MKQEIRIDGSGNKVWYLDGKIHREDGPAIEWADGRREWWLKGELHRTDGPAIEWPNGYWCWCLNGRRHRLGGPAYKSRTGELFWFINGEELTFEDYIERLKLLHMEDLIIHCLYNL